MSELKINDLNDDCFKTVFSYFNINEKLVVECVCLRWHQLIQQLLNRQKVLKIGVKYNLRDYYNCNDITYVIHQCQELRQNDDWINKEVITVCDLCSVLIRCPNIQYLYLCDCSLSVSTLEWIVCQLKHIKCLSLIAIQGLSSSDWERVWKAVSQLNLIHFTLSNNHLADIEITDLMQSCPNLQDLHLAYYRYPLTHFFSNLGPSLTNLSLIECFRTNLDSMKALVYGNAINIKGLAIYKVPTYDENILCEFIGLKMSELKRFSYVFDSAVPHIQPIEYLHGLQHLSLLSNDEYGIDLSSLLTDIMPNVKSLHLNLHYDPYMLRNLDHIFPNVESLDFSFDRICCNCDSNTENQNNSNNNNLNINDTNEGNNDLNANNNNNNNDNNVLQNNFIEDLNDDEPYVDDNCLVCSEKCVLILSKLDKLKSLTMNGERIKDSAVKALQYCDKLNHIVIDPNCKELNLKLLLISCIGLAQKNFKQLMILKLSHRFYERIINIKNIPKNFKIYRN